MDWNIAGSIATIVAAIVVVITAAIYWFQLRSMRKARELESALVILRYIDDIETTRARWFMYEHAGSIYNLFDDSPFWENRRRLRRHINKLSGGLTSLEQVEQSISVLNHIAVLIEEGHVSRELIPKYLSSTFLHCWKIFQPYIEHTRRGRETISTVQSNFGRHFENVVKQIGGRLHE
jgi:hypothetical protein